MKFTRRANENNVELALRAAAILSIVPSDEVMGNLNSTPWQIVRLVVAEEVAAGQYGSRNAGGAK